MCSKITADGDCSHEIKKCLLLGRNQDSIFNFRDTTLPTKVHKHSSVQFSQDAQSYMTLYDPVNCSTPGLPIHHQLRSLPKPMSIESVMPSNHLILCHPFLLLPSIFPSIRVFSNESALHIRWPKYWSFSFNISPSKEHPGLIFRMDCLGLPAV